MLKLGCQWTRLILALASFAACSPSSHSASPSSSPNAATTPVSAVKSSSNSSTSPVALSASATTAAGTHATGKTASSTGGTTGSSTGGTTTVPVTPIKIMPLGDSITFGCDLYNGGYVTAGGYRLPLWQMLQPTYAFDFVGSMLAGSSGPYQSPFGSQEAPGWDRAQEGHPGWTASDVLNTANNNINIWLPAANPEVVMMMLGTNDINQGYTTDAAIANMSQLYTTILAYPTVKHLFVASVIPSTNSTVAAGLPALNTRITSLVASFVAQGYPITFVDLNGLAGITGADLPDGIHPDDQGYLKMATVWKQALVQANVLPLKAVPQIVGDIDGDGKADLAWENLSLLETFAYISNNTTTLSAYPMTSLANSTTSLETIADFNGDGQADLVFRDYSTGNVTIDFQQGGSSIGTSLVTQIQDPDWHIVGAGNFSSTGVPSLLWENATTNQLFPWVMDGARFITYSAISMPSGWTVSGTGDFNGDGISDLLVRDNSTSQVAIFTLDANQNITSGVYLPTVTDPNWHIGAVADFNGDGSPDIVWYNTSTLQTSYWYMNGTTVLSAEFGPSSQTGWTIAGHK